MIVLRALGWILVIAGIASGVYEIYGWISSGTYRSVAAGEIWFLIDKGSLNLVQAVVQRYISVGLWDSVIQEILARPGWLVFGLPGLALVWFGRKRDKTRRR